MLGFKKLIGLLLLITISFGAKAALQIEITGGVNEGMKIAVLPFSQPAGTNVDVANVVSADLMRSGKFSPVAISSLPTNIKNSDNTINVNAFDNTNVQAVVFGSVVPSDVGYDVEFQLVSTKGPNKGKVLAHYRGGAPVNLLRQAAHRVSDRVYEKITGQPGAFRTRIAYVVTNFKDKYAYQLMTADYDGYNETPILRSTQPITTPNWSPDGTKLAYVSFESRFPAIFIQDIQTKKRVKVASFPGLNSSPAWSPDGTKIAMTLSKDGQPDIYYYDIPQNKFVRVTSSRAIDTEPSWSEDSKSLFFTSERGGRAQIYKFDFQTNKTTRITYQGLMNLSARSIPGEDALIVVTAQNGYRVARVDKDGSIYMLTTSSLDESPSVAPNGSMVIYSTVYQGRKGLAIVSTDGRFKANLPSNYGEISSPAWGPLVQR